MSRFQELIAAALRVCEAMDAGNSRVQLKAPIARLRTAVANVRQRGEEFFEVFSGVGMQGAAFVELSGPALPATLPAAAAAEIGRNLVAAAAVAETEAALLAELRAVGLENEQIGGLLSAMRRRRDGKE